ncbi:methyltransferase-like protein 22 isoform X2 [Eriocheir sinensis]|uniref:methyltransferase-like protein 22 isoform X2 n=1 Tax=Eriocheir sinensis TaxID=95602 RepID=UPI0021C69F8E|nr:methyltransferase-like protein 22 isoform X2 [Eriocheir sinensis]
MSDEEEEVVDNTVTSEVHHFSKEEVLDAARGAVLSRFDFVYPPSLQTRGQQLSKTPQVDSDGDLVVTRKNDLHLQEGVVLIEHQSATTLELVGEQVWRGALFLADFILHHHDIFRGAHVLEVASGVGLTSVVAAMLATKVTVTDVDKGEILPLIRRNLKRNEELLKAKVDVREIDFLNHATIDDLQADCSDVSIILAADVVYSNPLTDEFFRTVLRLMTDPPDKMMYIALEKRYVFTMEDMDTCAPCYDYFLEGLEWLRCQNLDLIDWTIEELSTDFQQYFTYERVRHLVLWKINSKRKII